MMTQTELTRGEALDLPPRTGTWVEIYHLDILDFHRKLAHLYMAKT